MKVAPRNISKHSEPVLIGGKTNSKMNKLDPKDERVHRWYRFVLSFPPHLVAEYIEKFGMNSSQTLLDPFCGTGTTLVQAKLQGIPSIGIEAHPIAHFASRIKIDWGVEPTGLLQHAEEIARRAIYKLEREGIHDELFFSENSSIGVKLRALEPQKASLLLKNSISPLPLHKVLTLLDTINEFTDESYKRHELLALANALVYSISNLKFGPEVGVEKPKEDVPVVKAWLSEVKKIAEDLSALKDQPCAKAEVFRADSRDINSFLKPNSIDAVITSPPYPNEKDYTRTTRLESVLLSFINSKEELRELKHSLVRSNTRGVYKEDDDDKWIAEKREIHRLAESIEKRRVELGKTSGFERLYPRVTKLYFGGMAKHLAGLREVLKPGAKLAYVVGDQASYLRVMIHTGKLLADIAQSLGYELVRIDLFRTRLATATRERLREEVVILRWPG